MEICLRDGGNRRDGAPRAFVAFTARLTVMKPFVAVVDYGMGNLRSVQKALEQAGAEARVTDSPAVLRKAQGVVLPGVGAFGEAVRRLRSGKLWNPLQQTLASNKPFLGIC